MWIKPEFEGKIGKWGNSYGIRIPKQMIDMMEANKGDELVIEIKDLKKAESEENDGPTGMYTFNKVIRSDPFKHSLEAARTHMLDQSTLPVAS